MNLRSLLVFSYNKQLRVRIIYTNLTYDDVKCIFIQYFLFEIIENKMKMLVLHDAIYFRGSYL